MVGAHAHPAGVDGQVVDPVGNGLAQLLVGEVVAAHLAAGRPWAAIPGRAFLNSPTFSFFLVSTLITGSAAVLMGLDLLVDVPELRVPVRVLRSLDRLGVALQAEPLLAEQVSHGVRTDPVALAGQLRRQVPGRLRGPPQRRHRIAPLLRLDQGQQRRAQPGIQVGRPLAAPARRRARPSGSAPASSSSTPSDTVASRTPAARATSRIPPCPSARASAPINSRRCRSSRCGNIASNFAASIRAVSSLPLIPHQHAGSQEATA